MKRIFTLGFICLLVFSCKNENTKQETSESETIEKSIIEFKTVEDAKLAAGKLLRVEDFPSEYIKPRSVDVWLPEDYSKDKKYNVLYMHDGQMLFDSTTTWNKQEWKVDEWATQLKEDDRVEDFIVVGIYNIADIRWQDLFPEKAFENLPIDRKEELIIRAKKNFINVLDLNGDDYLKFLVEELKPVIDSTYSVYTDQEHTFVMGSSMGGLMSMYAISEYPEVFGGAACISTHWVGAMPMDNNPYPDAIFKYMEANLPQAGQHKLYFDYGNKTLDEHYPQYAPRVDEILKMKGYSDFDSLNKFFDYADHSENSWNLRVYVPILFLMEKESNDSIKI
ncbi:alpha/beta hydrolase-fold protein [Winogradskyella sp. SYSU M77433]|uniref:alpha/beta hydrolase n=1 Tax=Winogradskyella sp. SYSU M77433 TaxID=3042722 RepID=UPI0024801FED|nr:alpha/beta hydrolase-fold protein [Winogradskyella sp. SYSU M77433]MDH7911924.1 alpha/beta hydrolase-fold protein [Winogradskyella sp. SYSU M77433]